MMGAVLGILLFAKVIEFSIQNYPKITASFFSLCIIPSLFYIIKPYPKTKKNCFFFLLGTFFLGIFMLFSVYFQKKTGVETTPVSIFSFTYGMKLFLCGLLAAGAMIIPGISRSEE